MSVRLPFATIFVSLLLLNRVQLAYISLENDWNKYPIRQQSPIEQMVDVVNNLGLNVLECHNIDNQNNIAFSPYGLTTVLIALYEGVAGEARFQIKRMTRFPNDVDVVRVGFRDIHRLLRSYFIPQEGFLAGLSLNNNVTFSPQYINILTFYGYDVEPNFTPQRPITTIIVPDTTIGTSPMTTDTDTTTIITTLNTDSGVKTTTDKSTTSSDITSTESTLSSEMNTTIVIDTRFDENTESTLTTTVTETTQVSSTESNTELTSKLQTETTDTDMKTTEMLSSSVGTTTDISTRSTDETTTEIKTTEITTNTVSLKTETTESLTSVGTTITSTEQNEETTTTLGTTVPETTVVSTTESMSTITENPSTTLSEFSSELTDESETDASTTENANGRTSTESPDQNDPDMDIAESIINPSAKAAVNNKTRGKRSFVDYLIARYYDNHGDLFNFQHPYITIPPAVDKHDKAFLVNGFEEHYDVNYTDFNGILPFAYVPTVRSMALRFPLDSERYYLLIILPINPQGINTVICDLRKFESLRNIIAQLKDTQVKASIPSFMLNGFVILTNTLQKLGVHNVFEPGHADFSPMTDNKNTYVTNIEQAVTVNIRNYMDPKTNTKKRHYNYQTVEFKVIHPFLYFIMDSDLNVSLMAGKILNPLNSRIQ